MYNLLLDKLPTEFNGHELNTDFRQVLKAFNLFKDDELSDSEKAIVFIRIFFKDYEGDLNEYMEFLNWYIAGAEEVQEEAKEENNVFDWELDSNYIYAAFYQVYKIDLTTVNMHWWKFLSLFNGLPNNTKLADIIKIRNTKVPNINKDNAEYVKSIQKAKSFFALNKKETKKSVGAQLQDLWGAI